MNNPKFLIDTLGINLQVDSSLLADLRIVSDIAALNSKVFTTTDFGVECEVMFSNGNFSLERINDSISASVNEIFFAGGSTLITRGEASSSIRFDLSTITLTVINSADSQTISLLKFAPDDLLRFSSSDRINLVRCLINPDRLMITDNNISAKYSPYSYLYSKSVFLNLPKGPNLFNHL